MVKEVRCEIDTQTGFPGLQLPFMVLQSRILKSFFISVKVYLNMIIFSRFKMKHVEYGK